MTRIARYGNRIFNCSTSPKPERDWRITSAKTAGHLPVGEIPLLEEKDLRKGNEDWWEIGNQEDTGSCVGWTLADSILRYQYAIAQRIKKDKNEKLSVRYLWMAAKEVDEFTDRPTTFIESYGTSIKAALGIVYKYGIVLEKDLPFKPELVKTQDDSSKPEPLFRQDESAFYAAAAKLRISAYFNLDTKYDHLNSDSSELDQKIIKGWKAWLCNNGPVAVRLDVDQSWMDLAIPDNKKEGQLEEYTGTIGLEGHACALVGYTQDGRFIVRNSWGPNWGVGGYAYATPRYALDAFTEAYGVVVEKGLTI